MTQEERQDRILSAAAELITRQGYDKTTMGDIAQAAGVSRGIAYLHFDSKQQLFDRLVEREVRLYVQSWLEHIEADPRGGTIGGIYRAVLRAINSRPMMAAMMRRDRRVVGSYLRKPDNVFSSMRDSSLGAGFLQALQEAGAVRRDVDPVITSHILDMLSYGLISASEFKAPEDIPDFDLTMEAIARMMDRLLTPEDGGNSEAGKAVIRELAARTQQTFERTDPSRTEGASR